MIRLKTLVTVWLIIATSSISYAQKAWSLENCIAYATEHNIGVKQTDLNRKLAKIDWDQSKMTTLPTVNGQIFSGYAYGQRIDPFTNRFADERIESVNLSLNGNLLLFSGFQVLNQIKQSKYNYLAGKLAQEQASFDLALNVAAAYLQVLFAEENLIIAQKIVENTELQVNRLRKLETSGTITKADLLNVEALKANEEVNLVRAENQLMTTKLALLQIMNASFNDIQVLKPEIDHIKEYYPTTSAEDIFISALQNQPSIALAEQRILAAKTGIAIAKGTFSPTIALTGSVGTGYSSIRQELDSGSIVITPKPPLIFPTLGGDAVLIPQNPDVNFNLRTIPFNNQMNQNLNQQIGIFLSMPILNGMQNHQNLKRAKINFENAKLESDNAKIQLRNAVYTAFTDMKAAYKNFIAAAKSFEAQKEAFFYTEQRFNAGAIQSFEYNETKNRLTNTEIQLALAKYEYMFRKSIVDFYSGNSFQWK